MKVSELTVDFLQEYVRADGSAAMMLKPMLTAAISYAMAYTGLTKAQLDDYEDITLAVMALVADMYDVRQYTVTNAEVNPTVRSILDQHSYTGLEGGIEYVSEIST